MIVYLLRHGEAEDIGPGGARTDADRRLTEVGRERLSRAARTWRRLIGTLDHIYTSPLVRAQQTAEILADAMGLHEASAELDCLVPEADPAAVARIIQADAGEGRTTVAFVGHEPHLGATLALLLRGRGSIPLKKGMLVGVELESVAASSGRLVCCLTTKAAARLSDKE